MREDCVKRLSSWWCCSSMSHLCPLSLSPAQLGIALGFLVPPVLVPNVENVEKLAYHISIMFFMTAGVATALFILVVIGKEVGSVCVKPSGTEISLSVRGPVGL